MPYSLAMNLISDLGNTTCGPDICSLLHGFMNATFQRNTGYPSGTLLAGAGLPLTTTQHPVLVAYHPGAH